MFKSPGWAPPRALWVVVALFLAAPASASPWAEVGDRRLRSDLEILANHGIIGSLLTTWPIPWAQISAQLPIDGDVNLPAHVRRSLKRVRKRMKKETAAREFNGAFVTRLTSEPALVRDFGTTSRDDIDTRVRLEYMGKSTAFRFGVGLQGDVNLDDPDIEFDDSYFASTAANWLLYGGVIDHWWGPGEVSSLILSNNSRPFPRIGIMRNHPTAFETPWLSWIGPWQLHAFAGVLDDDGREIDNTLAIGGRLALNPIDGLELGAAGTLMICGEGQPCNFDTFKDALFRGEDQPGAATNSNALAAWDFRYTSRLLASPFTLYGQMINEDFGSLEDGFFGHLSYLGGLTTWGPLRGDGALWRLTTEFSRTRAINNHATVGNNLTYNHNTYRSGYRYHDRTLGHSLDNDSVLFSLVATLTDIRDWTYRLAFHRAEINRDGSVRGGRVGKPLSASAEDINLVEAGLSVPLRAGSLEFDLRLQDNEPETPDDDEFEAAIEAGWTFRF